MKYERNFSKYNKVGKYPRFFVKANQCKTDKLDYLYAMVGSGSIYVEVSNDGQIYNKSNSFQIDQNICILTVVYDAIAAM